MTAFNSRSLNQVNLVGRLTENAVLRQTQSGKSYVTFTVATEQSYKDEAGQWKSIPTFIPCMAFAMTDYVVNNFAKGDLVQVTGSIVIRKKEDGTTSTFVRSEAQQVLVKKSATAQTTQTTQAAQVAQVVQTPTDADEFESAPRVETKAPVASPAKAKPTVARTDGSGNRPASGKTRAPSSSAVKAMEFYR